MNAKTFSALCVLIIITTMGFGCRSIARSPNRNDTVQYRVAAVEDISSGDTKMYVWEVVVEEQANVEQLKDLSRIIIEEAKTNIDFNAISIAFYDYEEYLISGYTLGKVDYAPGGELVRAGTVRAGEYGNMEYRYFLREKNWDKQLTEEEVRIFAAWSELYYSRLTQDSIPKEEEISKEVAQTLNVDVEEVDRIVIKQTTWTYDDKQIENQPGNQPRNQPRNQPVNQPGNLPGDHPGVRPGKPCC